MGAAIRTGEAGRFHLEERYARRDLLWIGAVVAMIVSWRTSRSCAFSQISLSCRPRLVCRAGRIYDDSRSLQFRLVEHTVARQVIQWTVID
jgi:hypothetical protein